MPFVIESHDDLPYIDAESSAGELDAARSVLEREMKINPAGPLHSSIDVSYSPRFSELMNASLEAIVASGEPRASGEGVDLLRYEEPSPPTIDPSMTPEEQKQRWTDSLNQMFTSHAYLSERKINLALLERFGKNAWLIGNSQIEEELRSLERELADVKRQVESIDEERRKQQENARGEIEGLEEAWRAGIGRAIEVEIATDALRRDIMLKRKRTG